MPIDSHCHMQFRAYNEDRDKVIERAKEKGWRMVTVGTNLKTSISAADLAQKNRGWVFATVGLHPVHLFSTYVDEFEEGPNPVQGFKSKSEDFDPQLFLVQARREEVVGIGEIGLDFFHISKAENKEEEVKRQKEAFLEQLELAVVAGKPLVLHCRDAYNELADILDNRDSEFKGKEHLEKIKADGPPGALHCFTGTWEEAQRFLDLGFYIGFTGIVTFPPRKSNPEQQEKLLDAVRRMPLERILVETDAPYLAPLEFRGKRAEPWMCEEVIKKLSEIRNEPFEKILSATEQNAKKVFRIE